MNKLLVFVLLAIVLSAGLASAKSAAYIVRTPGNADAFYITTLQNMGYTVDIVDDDAIPSNITSYSFILVNNENFPNPQNIPVNTMPALLINTYNVDDWHWAGSIGSKVPSGFLKGQINDLNHPITQNVSDQFQFNIYTSTGLSHYYLPKTSKAVKIKSIIGLSSDPADAMVAVVEPGMALRDGVNSSAKGVFFGMDDHNVWTASSLKAFQNSVTWLTTDFAAPALNGIAASKITNQSASINWSTNCLYCKSSD